MGRTIVIKKYQSKATEATYNHQRNNDKKKKKNK